MPQMVDDAGNIWNVDAQGNVLGLATPAQRSAGRVVTLPPSPEKVREQSRQAAADARAERGDKREQARFDKENLEVSTPGDTSKTGEEYLATLPPALAAQVKAMAEGRRAFPTGSALRSPAVMALVAAATQYDPTLDAANAATRVATRKDFTSGKAAQNITAINTALGHLGTLEEAAKGLHNRSFPLWNTLANAAESAVGDPRVKTFTVARDAAATELMRVFRGVGASTSEIEEWKNTIDSSDSPEQLNGAIKQAVELLNSRLESMGQQYQQGLGSSADPLQLLSPHAREVYDRLSGTAKQRADNEVPDPTNAAGLKPPPHNGSPTPPEDGSGVPVTPWSQRTPDGQTIAQGKARTEHSDKLSAQVDAMVNAGASKAMIDAVLRQQNYPPLDPSTYTAAKKWMQDNPGQKYFGATVDRQVPLSALESLAGSALGSGAAQYANAATAGAVGALAGDQGRGALAAMRETHPNMSAAGELIGGVTGAAGLELGAGRLLAPGLARFAPRIADATYGGISGATSEDSGLDDVAMGAGAGLLGGIVGDRAMRAAAAATRGVRNPAVVRLRDEGIPLTVGQTVGDSGWLGAGLKKMEDAATSLPFIGNMIEARRMEGLRAFNDAAFNAAAAPGTQITGRGAQGMTDLRQGVQDAYGRALDPVTIDANDPQLIAELGATINAARGLPDEGPLNPQGSALTALRYRMNNAVDPATDQMTGRGFQEAYRGLGRTSRTWNPETHDYAAEVRGVMRQGQDALGEALERQNPGAFDAFLEANAANRRANVLADALKNAGNQAEELVTPAQLNRADIGSTSRLEGKINSAAGNRPFYDLATAGQAVLPSRLPDSGTWTRLLTGGALTGALGGGGALAGGGEGAATGTGLGLGATIALALGGSRGAQNVAVRALMDRPDIAIPIAEQIERRLARPAGLTLGSYLSNAVAGP